ncbi:hypothetical protein SAMN04488696_1857 [Methanolobus profundi]|uniref:Uncharacterized protein n=1 Tax=Methanolobus profundi TaxID=487685 RepID=A0A1I4S9V1_9EURY|nr:hypothetical protein SAMN04488696_1857 [Methanolobus profundi]
MDHICVYDEFILDKCSVSTDQVDQDSTEEENEEMSAVLV